MADAEISNVITGAFEALRKYDCIGGTDLYAEPAIHAFRLVDIEPYDEPLLIALLDFDGDTVDGTGLHALEAADALW